MGVSGLRAASTEVSPVWWARGGGRAVGVSLKGVMNGRAERGAERGVARWGLMDGGGGLGAGLGRLIYTGGFHLQGTIRHERPLSADH